MGRFDVNVPLSLLKDVRLTNADRRVWQVMRLDRKDRTITDIYSPTRLAERTKLSRVTIYCSIARLAAAGWYDKSKPDAVINNTIKQRGWVNMPAEVVVSEELLPRDVVMWGLLKEKVIKNKSGDKFTYKSLGIYAQFCLKTIRRAIKALRNADWLNTKQKNQRAAIEFTLDSPSDKYCRDQKALTEMRLNRDGGHGEAIALAIVTLVAEPTEYWVRGRPDILVNPETGELMEIDIYLPKYKLAIEFHGAQHFRPTSFASAEDVAEQQKRDALKVKIMIVNKITPVVLTAEDLSVAAVITKLRGLISLRDLRLYKKLVDYLNKAGERYRRKGQRLAEQEVRMARIGAGSAY